MDDKVATLGFAVFSGIGTIRFEKLLTHFGRAEKAWHGEKEALIAILGKAIGEKFVTFRQTFSCEKYAEELGRKHIHFFVPSDKIYPLLLHKLPHPPYILFARGNVELLQEEKSIAIVGSRKITPYGREVTSTFAQDLTLQGFVIVSGMALGVDGVAHNTALQNHGKTIAVLGSGVDVPTPYEHTQLYNRIIAQDGLVVSTFLPGQRASTGSFPARNAIIAGLSLGVLVTEAGVDSGALITAKDAKEIGRPVFAVPGQITSHLSKGTNSLIQQGAIAVGSATEILDRLGIMKTQNIQSSPTREKNTTSQEKAILTLLENGPLHFNEIVQTIGKDSKAIGVLLSFMELGGLIKTNEEGEYFL